MDRESLRVALDRKDHDRIHGMGRSEVGPALVALMQEEEGAGRPIDADLALSRGVHISKAGHEDADGAVLAWLADAPSERRLDLVVSFLAGVWIRDFRRGPVPAGNVRSLVRSRGTLALKEGVEYAYAQALCQALAPDADAALRREVEAVLRGIRQKDFRPPVDRLLKSLVDRTLGEARG